MVNQIVAQPYDWEIGIHYTHEHADAKQQDEYLDGVVDKEIGCLGKRLGGIKPKHIIYQPIGKLLYHKSILLKLLSSSFLLR